MISVRIISKGSSRHHRGHSPFPFDRFLNSRLGRPWDEVYSEVSQSFDHRSYAGHSFFRDLRWHVATNCWIGAETGTLYSNEYGGSVVQNEFYVHPWTGILSWAEPVDRTWPNPPKTQVDIEVKRDDYGKILTGKFYEKVDGIWYYFETYSIEHQGFTNICPYDGWRGETVEIDGEKLYRLTWNEHINIKRQLSKKELRQNGLHNGSRFNAWKRCAVCGANGFRCIHIIKEEAEKRSKQWPYCVKGS